MSIVNLMSRLNRLRVKVGVEDERLVIDAPEQSLTPALVAELKERKLELIEFLGSFRRQEYTPIPPVEERDYYPLSHAQKRLWIINRVTGSDNTAYNMPAAFMVSGGPDTDALTEAFRQLIRRHESLRTFFTTVRGEPVQVVAKEVEFSVENITPAGEPGSEDREGSIKEMVRQHAEIHFDLSCVPLFNASVVTIDRERHLFLLNIHHIISDGWSIPVFLEELSILYNAYHTDDHKELLPPLRIQYKDYARWQNTFAVSSEAEEQKAYWNQKLSGEIPVLDLPIDFERTTAGTNQGDILHRTLDRSMTEGANRYCNEQGATLLMFLSAAVKTLLYRYTGQEDMIIGTVAAGRNHPDLEDQLGFYVNTLALRDGLDGEEPFTTFLHRVKQTAGDAFRHQTYPFDRLVDHLDLGRDTLRHPLFDVMVVVQNAGEGELKFNNLAITPLESRSNSSKFDLTFYFGEINHEIHLDLEYDSGLFREDRIRRMGNHFNELVESILSDPGQAVADLNIISPKEKHRVLVEFNGTQTAYPVEATIAGLFEEQAARTPDAIALVEIGPKGQTVRVQLTYNQLDEQAGKLSFQLRSKGVGNDTIVGLQTERTAAMIIGLLGILKAGGAYLPLTANYPQERIDYMLRDSGVEVLISSGIPRFDTPPPSGVPLSRGELAGVRLIDLKGIDGSNHSALGTGDDLNAEGFNSPLERGTPPAAGGGVSHRGRPPNSLAYIMYTSGSTGIPKGVMIEQKSVIRLVKKTGYIQITGQDRLLATCSLSFDVSTFEIWGSLLNGGTLYISGLDDIITPAVLSRILTDWGITIMWMTVGLFNQMADIDVEIFRPLSTLLVGGDRLSPVHIQKIRARYPAMQIINGYGPTENTSFTTTYSIGETITNDIPIGKPISNTRVYILDNRFHPVPVGVVGELCAAGDGLARGYLNNPELTGKKFDVRTSHFALYHTGDMARWLPDGNIEFLGRRDHQVKVRGFRIELGEIEYRLTQLPGISEAAVMVVENQREKELIAYIAAAPGLDSDTPVDVNIKEQLTEFLPDYMAPSHFIRLDKLPLNPSGKIDKKTLLMQFQPGTLQRRESYVPPRTQTEQKLVEIWQDILNRETIGVTDNFFEAGGHSLKATRLVSRVHKDLSVELRLQDIFKYRTVSQLARFINKKELSRFTRVQPVPVQDHYDLSHAQRRLWVLDRFEEGGSGYNIPYALTFTGPLDTGAFNRAFHCLIRRHESLRTGFTSIEGVPKQIIHPTLNFEVREVSLLKEPDRAKREKQAKTIAQQHAERVFDLTRVPLFDASLLEVAEDRHIFLFNMHHIVTDGWSMEVFARELAMFYNSLVTKGPRQTQNQDDLLPPLRIQYKDYAHWQHTHLNSPIASKAKAYWHAKLSGPPPALDFPIDYPRPRFKTSNGSVFQFELDDHLLPAIKELCTRQGITLFMLLTAAVNILLHRYTNQEDIVIGTPNAGRNHPDLEEQIGFYINTLALRGKVEADKTVVSFLKQVKQTVLDADQFQIYPFDSLVEELNLDRDTRRHPLFDIMIVMQNNDQPDLIFENITITPFEFEYNTSKFDMTFYFTETAEGIQVAVNYNTDILKKERIQRLRDHFSTLLTGILKEPGSAVSEISILSAEEEQSSETFKAELPLIEPSTVMDLFLENAGRLPDKPAIVYDTGQLTYSQLDRLTNRLAHCLQQLGIEAGQETPAAAMFGNDVRQVISLLAIFKARGIYVPIDTGSPADRLSQLFLQVEPKVLLTGRETSREILESAVSHPGFPLYIIAIDGSFDFRVYRCQDGTAVEESFDDFPGTCPLLELSLPLHAGSYIFFTSGSTGQPKAMLGSHTSLYHFIRWQSGEFGIDENCQCSQLSQSTFDASLRDIFVPLCSGGTLYIPGQATKDNLHKLLQWISLSRITLMNTVPSLLRSLMDIGAGTSLEHLQHLFVSGEPLFDGDIHRWRKCFGNTTELVNFYGTSETTMSKTFYRMPGDKIDIPPRIPTGPPLPNTMVAVIRDRRTCAVGEVGEIYIKTAYPTKGYYNNKPLTDSVFIPNPLTGDTGDIVHRTGDLGRYLPDMTVEVLGRVDHQVKINGIRVEPAEIEHRLTQHPEVEEAAVIARKIRDETDETVLAAFIVSNSHLDSNQIREYLSRFLPRYMVPSHVIKPDRLPRTASGKIDRNALSRLPLPDTSDHQRYVPPRNDTEKKLADIWQEVLNKETIGINDNFFAAGGHSLKAVQIVSRTHKTLSVELSLRDIFAFPTIAQLARQVEQTPGSRFSGIQPVEKKEYYELSNAQRRLWVIQQLDEKSISYNRPSALTIDGELNIPALTGAFRALIHRHESLRTSFITVNGAPKQIIHPAVAFTIREVSLMDINETDSLHREESVREIVRHHAAMVFDLSRAPLFDAMVLKTSRQRHVFLFNMHHIVTDGWSWGIITKQLEAFYNALNGDSGGLDQLLPPLNIQYKDYAGWQNSHLSSPLAKEAREYWHHQFSGELPLSDLPTDRPRPAVKTVNGNIINHTLGNHLTTTIDSLCSEREISLFMCLLSAVYLLIYRYTGQDDLIIGSPTAGRNHVDLEEQIGFYVNTLALRCRIDRGEPVATLFHQVKQTATHANDYQVYPFDKLVDELNLQRDTGRHPLFDVMVILHNTQQEDLELGNLEITPFETGSTTSRFDLALGFIQINGHIDMIVEYNTDLFETDRIQRLCTHFSHLLEGMTRDPEQSIKDVEILSIEEKHRLLVEFNDTQTETPTDKTIVSLFEEQVGKVPDSIAVKGTHGEISYLELHRRSSAVAYDLRENHGVRTGDRIAIMPERNEEMIIGLMGILMAGAAYVPIDPGYPQERIEYMLRDSGAGVLIGSGITRCDTPPPAAGGVPLSRGEFGALKLVELNRTTNSPLERGTLRNEGGGVSHGNLAYIIYTSGSTGKPKGVMVEHRGIVNTSLAQQSVICQGETDNILQFASLSFDASAFEIFMALLSGASLVTVPAQVIDHVPGFIHHLYKYRVTIVVLPPVYLNKLEKRDPGPLRLIFTAGEAPVLSDVIHYSRTIDYINGYGPTETSIWASYSRPKIDSDPHIGKPISNTYIYITDRDLQPVPVGVTGEICIGGAGLARGYIDRPQLTAQRFIPNPFQKSERLYKTGDLGRWLPGGDIQFLGRRDYQVKIRGFRIELGEIEHRLTTHPDIMECAAVAVQPEGTGPKELASFVVCNPGSNPKQEPDNTAAFREYLSRFLPLYMIPSYFVSLDRLPVNASGKIDRKALSRLPLHISDPRFQSAYISPRNRVEQVLAEAWEEVLGRERVSMEDNFFEMGGDSIKAIQIASKLHRHGMKVAVKELFGHPTISGLSPFVKTIQRQAQQETVAGNVSLTPIQRWFFEREFTNAHHFNQSVMLYKEEGFETALLETVFTEILRHHDALRMVFLQGTGGVAQVNRGTGDADGPLFHLDVVRLDNNGDVPLEVLEEIIKTETNQTQAGINPEQGPLVKLKLFKTPDGDHLLIVVHHLVMDGVSWRILLEDLDRAYRQLEKGEEIVLPPKTDSFQYWAEKQEHYAAGGKVSAELPYWKRIIDAETGHLSRDTGIHGGDDNKQEHGQSLTVDLTKEETNRLLHQTRHAYNTEINDLLLTALALSLRQWRGMEKVRVNLEGHGREDIIDDVDIGRTIGWFTTQFPVLLETSPEKDIAYHIQNIKETLHGIPNKGIGFGILKYLSKHKEELASYEPPDIGFNYLGDFQQGPEEVVFQFSPLSAGDSISPEMERFAALNITGILVNRQLTFRFDYNRREYRESSIHQLAELFKTSLLDITRHCTGIRETQLTPSDYGDHQLSLEDLEKIRPLYSDDPHLIIDKIYSLGPMQEGLLFHRLLDDQSAAYFEQTTLYLEGNLDPSTMECSINSLIHRHDILRTSFVYREIKEPRQVVFKERPVTLFFEDLSGLKEEEQERHIMEYNEAGKKEGFHLTRDPLLRFALFKLNNHLHALIWSHHHILMDGWCIGILLNELLTGYQCLAAGKTPDLPVPLPYRDYIRWLERQDREEGLKYWKTYLEGYDRQVVLPQFSRQEQETSPGTQTYRPGLHRFTFDERLTSALEVVAGAGHVTLNTLFQTGWAIILQRYNNCDDVVFGSVVSGRSAGIPGIETMIGLFINTLPVRIKSGLNQTFRDLLKEVQEQAHLSRANENVPLARVQSVSPLKGDLINHLVIFENYPFEPGQQHPPGENSTGFTVMGGETDEQTHYDFNIMVVPGPQLTMTFRYNKNRYDAAVIQRIGSHLEQVLGQVSSNRDIYIKDIQLITPGEKQLLLEQFNDTQRQLPENKTVAHLFEEQVVKRPDRISTAHPRSAASVTYKQLNESSNRLALLLKESGLEPGEIVAIMTERSIGMMVGLMGILKAGASYLPIDPDYPQDRIDYILGDSGTRILIESEKHNDQLSIINYQLLMEPSTFSEFSVSSAVQLKAAPRTLHPDDLAYVIYTSGSTGKPKGVAISHRQVLNFITGITERVDFSPGRRIAAVTTISFDIFLLETLLPLSLGVKVIIAGEEAQKNPALLEQLLLNCHVDMLQMTPSHLQSLIEFDHRLEGLGPVEDLMIGGESFPPDLLERLNRSRHFKGRIYNMYGPTETTVWSAVKDLTYSRFITIGKPIANTQIHILDRNNALQPPGIPGELFIGGDGVGIGYLNRPELTAEKFLDVKPQITQITQKKDLKTKTSSSSAKSAKSAVKLYKTGDLARWLPDGNIQFLGRIDYQVKIRGFRIELGEIQCRLSQHPGIREAVVIAKEMPGGKELAAFLVTRPGVPPNTGELRSFLAEFLPDYMIPSQFVILERIPLTPNGKINRNALKESTAGMDQPALSSDYAAPGTETETLLVTIWEDLLSRKPIGIHDNFFEVGGDSIKAIQLIARLHRFELDLDIQVLFRFPTISGLADRLSVHIEKADQRAVEGVVPLTPVQQWFFEHFTGWHRQFNQSTLLASRDRLEPGAVRAVLSKLQEHHDALRSTFRPDPTGGGIGIVQEVSGIHHPLSFEIVDLRDSHDAVGQLENHASAVKRSIDIGAGPLMKTVLYSLNEGDRLFIVIHHLVVDGVSWRILLEDLQTGYRQFKMKVKGDRQIQLPLKSHSYNEWSRSVRQYSAGPELLKEKEYWLMVKEESRLCEPLPIDFHSGDDLYKDSRTSGVTLPEDRTRVLQQEVSGYYKTGMQEILLAALSGALTRWHGNSRTLLLLEGHGRETMGQRLDTSRTVGWFTSMSPLVLECRSNDPGLHLREVKARLEAVPNKGTGYGILKYLASHGEELSVSPQIAFNYLGQFDRDINRGLFETAGEDTGDSISPGAKRFALLDVAAMMVNGKLELLITYNKKKYNESTIRQLLKYYEDALTRIISQYRQTVATGEKELASPVSERLQAMIDQSIKGSDAVGALMMVKLPGCRPWFHGCGYAVSNGIETPIHVHSAMTFKIGSITKTFNAVIMLQLAREGKVDLDHAISNYLPGLIPGAKTITLRQLLNHTSGLPEYGYAFLEDNSGDIAYSPLELVRGAGSLERDFAPGGGFLYSGTNYLITGLVAEAVTGETFGHLLRHRILDPLGMFNTHFPSSPVPDEFNQIDSTWAAGAMVSDMKDLHIFLDALVKGTLIPKEMQKEWKTTIPAHMEVLGHLEVGPGILKIDNSLVSGGETRGYSAFMGYVEKHDTYIVAMTRFNQKDHPTGASFRLYSRARGVLFEE